MPTISREYCKFLLGWDYKPVEESEIFKKKREVKQEKKQKLKTIKEEQKGSQN